MYVTNAHRPFAIAAVTAALFMFAVPGAVASPAPEPQQTVTGCPVDAHELSAALRTIGYTAQAANVATRLAERDCRALL